MNLVSNDSRILSYVGGKLLSSSSGRVGPVFNPATGDQVGVVEMVSADEVNDSVTVARGALDSWANLAPAKRAEVLFTFRGILRARAGDLAQVVASEHGKVVADALGEVQRGLENVEFACGIADLLRGRQATEVASGVDVVEIRQPLGVVAGITPFNFPVMVPLWMAANALACGNAMILKPSERDPSASVMLAEMLTEAGLPDGIFNVVQGDKQAVDGLLSHPDIQAISFVGSTPVARYVYETAAAHGKRVQALGGAKNHMIVLPDADLEAAADAAVSSAFGSAGERCMAISVLVPVGDIADPLIELIRQRAASLKVGDGRQPDSEMGPLITRDHETRVKSYISGAQTDGASVVLDGREPEAALGFFVGPTIIDQVERDMPVYRDEIFGPVLSVVRASSFDEALTLVNSNPYGNGAALFTASGGAARRFQLEVQAGMVGINVPIPVPVAQFSFGGWKNSLFGDSPIYGHAGVSFYTRTKVVTSRWQTAGPGLSMSFPTG